MGYPANATEPYYVYRQQYLLRYREHNLLDIKPHICHVHHQNTPTHANTHPYTPPRPDKHSRPPTPTIAPTPAPPPRPRNPSRRAANATAPPPPLTTPQLSPIIPNRGLS